jgi:hypothetical protein
LLRIFLGEIFRFVLLPPSWIFYQLPDMTPSANFLFVTNLAQFWRSWQVQSLQLHLKRLLYKSGFNWPSFLGVERQKLKVLKTCSELHACAEKFCVNNFLPFCQKISRNELSIISKYDSWSHAARKFGRINPSMNTYRTYLDTYFMEEVANSALNCLQNYTPFVVRD